MAVSEKEVEEQLIEAGNQLLSPPSSVTNLIYTLDQVESLLTRVEQSPSESVRKALSPSIKALIANELLRHSDIDVRVAVASCISEITRITAPDAPYEDDQMKEVFELIVSTFEKLDDQSSQSYIKRTAILEIVAKVRSCVVMLDLECDALIAEMFQHFFRSIRSEHPANVFSSMETIMTLVLEESEDVPVDLVSVILKVLKTENKEVLPIARQLGEKLLEKCVTKIEPCLEKAMKYLHTTKDDYPKVVTNILKQGSEATETRDAEAASKTVADKNDVANEPTEKAVEVSLETTDGAPPSEEVAPTTVGSPKSVVNNGTIQKESEDTSLGNENAKDANNEPHGEEAEPGKTKVENSDAEEAIKSLAKPEKVNRRKGKKKKSSKSSFEPPSTDEKEGIAVPEVHEKDDNAQIESSAVETEKELVETEKEPVVIEKESTDTEKEPETEKSDEPVDVPSPSPSGNLVDENPSKKVESGEEKGNSVEDLPADNLELKESEDMKSVEEASVIESKAHKRTGKKVPSVTDKEDSAPSSVDVSNKEDEKTSESDAKSAKQSGKKVQIGSKRDDKKKRGQAKVTPTKDSAKSPAKDEGKKSVGSSKSVAKPAKDESDVERTSKSTPKRKRSSEKKSSNSGEELVGSKIKVWWPDDQKFYAGIIEHFDPSTKKHKITYNDGDVEVLKLANEEWKLDDGSVSDQGDSSDGESADEMAETPKAKKTKTNLGTKQGKTEASTKKGGTSSSKPKATSKSRNNQTEDKKSGGKAKDATPKSIAKSEESKGGKTKDSKSSNTTPKSVGKSKEKEVEPIKGSNKSKQEKSKATSSKSGGKSQGSSKAKTSQLSDEEDEEKESSPEPVKTSESSKRKSSSKSQKTSKKRKIGTKG